MISLQGGGLVAAFFGARAGPGPALAPGPAAPAWPWNQGPLAPPCARHVPPCARHVPLLKVKHRAHINLHVC